MKILIHSTTLDGEPLQADSIALNGKNCAELVEIMKGQTHFTIATTTRDYMLGVLGKIETERNFKLSEDPEAAAAELSAVFTIKSDAVSLQRFSVQCCRVDQYFHDSPPEIERPGLDPASVV
jgi:hypothetical protein